MRKTGLFLALALLSAALQAQEIPYALPATSVTVKVEVRQESFFAGPYAPFAKKYLGMDVPQEDAVRVYVKEVKVAPRVEADQSVRYSVDPRTAEPFLALSAQGLVAFPKKADAQDVTWRFTPLTGADFSGKGVTAGMVKETQTLYKTVRTDSTFSSASSSSVSCPVGV